MALKREVERRNLARPVEFRAAKTGDGVGTLEGYAAVFGALSQNLGGYVETIDSGAFTKSLADGGRVLCRFNHDDAYLLGTTDAGTLTVTVDDVGLKYVDDLPDTGAGRDVAALAKRNDVRNSSFAFVCIEEEWGLTPQDFPVRTILQAQLVDVAPVVNPAYLDASVGLRSLAAHLHLEVVDLVEKPIEEIRSLMLGEPAPTVEVPAPVTDAVAQRETHAIAEVHQRYAELLAKR